MSRPVHIAIAELSDIVRRGLTALLQDAGPHTFVVTEIAVPGELKNALALRHPDILVANLSFPGIPLPAQLRREYPELICVLLQTSLAEGAAAAQYDESVSLYDTAANIREKLSRLAADPGNDPRREPLSQREKDIIALVVQGMTNRQIAEKLCLSPHTVNTHRRNIAAKLDIHSTSGLTIYAISNQLVKIDN